MDVQLLNKTIFIAICVIISLCDIKKFLIPNWIVLPAIAIGIYLTGNWHWALLMFSIGAVFYRYKYWAGGDVKMLSMVGAFLGIKTLYILGIFIIIVNIIKIRKAKAEPIALAPYLFASSLIFIW